MSIVTTLVQGLVSQVVNQAGPQGTQITNALISMITQQGNGQAGAGLGNIIAQFEQNGLGEIVKTWIGTGANAAINPEQITQTLGAQNVQNIAQQAGINAEQAPAQLANILPELINQLTPNGQLDANVIGDVLQAFIGKKAA